MLVLEVIASLKAWLHAGRAISSRARRLGELRKCITLAWNADDAGDAVFPLDVAGTGFEQMRGDLDRFFANTLRRC